MTQSIEKLKEEYQCPKCRGKSFDDDIISIKRSKRSKIFPGQHHKLLMITCALCGYTEFYNLSLYERAVQTQERNSICSQEA